MTVSYFFCLFAFYLYVEILNAVFMIILETNKLTLGKIATHTC